MPNPRVTQLAPEVAVVRSDAKPRVTQLAPEVAVVRSDAKPRVTQLVAEVAYRPPFASLLSACALTCTIIPASIDVGATLTSESSLTATINAPAAGQISAQLTSESTLSAAVAQQNHLGALLHSESVLGATIHSPLNDADFELGAGLPFSFPRDVEILMGIGEDNALINVSDEWVYRDSIWIRFDRAGGVSTAGFRLRPEIGNFYALRGLQKVYIKDAGRTYGGGRYYRLFGGWTESEDSTQDALDLEVPIQCVGFSRLLDYPPKSVSVPWPPSFDGQGTPVVYTTSEDAITAGANREFVVHSSNNIYAGKELRAVNADGTNGEWLTIDEVGVSDNGLRLRADFASDKAAGWSLQGGISDLEFYKDGWWALTAKTKVTAPVSTPGLQTVTPWEMTGITEGATLICFSNDSYPLNGDWEMVEARNVTATTFEADFQLIKSSYFRVHVLTYIRGYIDEFYNDTLTTTVAAAQGPGYRMVAPLSMENIIRSRTMWCVNADGTGGEEVTVDSVTLGAFFATFTKPKSAGWVCHNGPYVSKAGVAEVIRSLGHIRLTEGTPRDHTLMVRAQNADPTKAPRDFISHLADSPDHLTAFAPMWVHYDALAPGLTAPVTLSNYETLDPDEEAQYESYNLSKAGAHRFNSIAVTGRNNARGSYTDWDNVLEVGQIFAAPTMHDNALFTNALCDERAQQIVQNNLLDDETFHIITFAEVDPEVLRQPMNVALKNYAEYAGTQEFPVSSVRLSYDTQALRARYTFELNEVPADMDGQLMPLVGGRWPHTTGSPSMTAEDFSVLDGGPAGDEPVVVPDLYHALYDPYGHLTGFAPTTPVLYMTGDFTPQKTTRDYAVDTTAGNIVVTMPPAADRPYHIYSIKKVSADANTVTIQAAGGEGIDAPAAPLMVLTAQGQAVTLRSDGVDTYNVRSSHGFGGGGTGKVPVRLQLGGNGVPLTPGDKGFWTAYANMTLLEWRILGNSDAACIFYVSKTPYTSFPTGFALLHSPFDSPRLTVGDGGKNTDSVLSTWERAINIQDVIKFELVSADAPLTLVDLVLTFQIAGGA